MPFTQKGGMSGATKIAIDEIKSKYITTTEDILLPIVVRGTATDGLNGFIEDTTKTWQEDQFVGKEIKLEIDDIIYRTHNFQYNKYDIFSPIEPNWSDTFFGDVAKHTTVITS